MEANRNSNTKQIQFNREDKDFSAYLNGEYVGSYRSYLAAEVALNAMVFQTLTK